MSKILHPVMGLGVMLALVLSAGCGQPTASAANAVTSNDPVTVSHNQPGNEPAAETQDSATRVPTDAVSGGESAVTTNGDEWPLPMPSSEALTGMYGWDPHGGFHNAEWSGTLAVAGPCVYLDVTHQDGTAVAEGERLRSYVRLPEPLTRYDAATGEIWVAGNGPMTDGDNVTVHGSQGWKREWSARNDRRNPENMHVFEYVSADLADPMSKPTPVCAAHVSFYATSMHATHAQDPYVPNTSELSGLELFDWDDDRQWPAEGANGGILVIEPPCVYYDLVTGYDEQWDKYKLDEPIRYRLILARPLVRYDPNANTLWTSDDGPMTNGDEVWGTGTGRPNQGPDARSEQCPAAGDYKTPSIGPRKSPS